MIYIYVYMYIKLYILYVYTIYIILYIYIQIPQVISQILPRLFTPYNGTSAPSKNLPWWLERGSVWSSQASSLAPTCRWGWLRRGSWLLRGPGAARGSQRCQQGSGTPFEHWKPNWLQRVMNSQTSTSPETNIPPFHPIPAFLPSSFLHLMVAQCPMRSWICSLRQLPWRMRPLQLS